MICWRGVEDIASGEYAKDYTSLSSLQTLSRGDCSFFPDKFSKRKEEIIIKYILNIRPTSSQFTLYGKRVNRTRYFQSLTFFCLFTLSVRNTVPSVVRHELIDSDGVALANPLKHFLQ